MSPQLISLAKEGKINEGASLRDRQSVIINVPQSKVWETLVQMEKWPEWNQDIKFVESSELATDKPFRYKLGKSTVKAVIRTIDEPNTISWTGKTLWINNILVWKLESTEENQTIVTGEESMEGFLLPLFISHYRLHNLLLNWLSRLKIECEEI